MVDVVKDQNKFVIKSFLNTSKVKLWLKPYSNPDGSKDMPLESLAKEIATKQHIDQDAVTEILEELRVHSCMKFNAQSKFRENGIAMLELKIVSSAQAKSNAIPNNQSEWIEIKLDSLGIVLKRKISERVRVEPHNMKFICSGRNIDDDMTLEQQSVRNLAKIMVLCLTNEETSNLKIAERESLIGRAKKAASLITDTDYFNLELEDQNGKKLDIPKVEKKSLAVAMMLHEKGRASMQNGECGLALIYLLESDSEFIKCNSTILDVVDNFALLNLDIVWCYFKLHEVSSLQDAERRLALCDEKFKKTYGANLERVKKLKGGTSKELAIVSRLHLMQSAVCFYKGMYKESLNILEQTEKDLKTIKVDEQAMIQVMEVGFSEREARLSLRFSNGDVEAAIDHIMTQRQNKRKIREEEQRKKKQKKTLDGQPLDTNLLQYLVDSMGFKSETASSALITTNNDLTKAIDVLQTLSLSNGQVRKIINEVLLSQLASLGFNSESVRQAILGSRSTEDVLAILEDVRGGLTDDVRQRLSSLLQEIFSVGDNTDNSNGNAPAESGGASASGPSRERARPLKDEDHDLVEEEMLSGIDWSDDNHLDYTLEEELDILHDFKAKLSSLGYSGSST